jgi:hypothetical protein
LGCRCDRLHIPEKRLKRNRSNDAPVTRKLTDSGIDFAVERLKEVITLD